MLEAGHEPKAIAARPELPSHLGWLWDAFRELSTDRQIGFDGPGPIPFLSIDCYATRFGIDGDDFTFLLRCIRVLDLEWDEHQRQRRKAKQ
jgi:hypothetical protein